MPARYFPANKRACGIVVDARHLFAVRLYIFNDPGNPAFNVQPLTSVPRGACALIYSENCFIRYSRVCASLYPVYIPPLHGFISPRLSIIILQSLFFRNDDDTRDSVEVNNVVRPNCTVLYARLHSRSNAFPNEIDQFPIIITQLEGVPGPGTRALQIR